MFGRWMSVLRRTWPYIQPQVIIRTGMRAELPVDKSDIQFGLVHSRTARLRTSSEFAVILVNFGILHMAAGGDIGAITPPPDCEEDRFSDSTRSPGRRCEPFFVPAAAVGEGTFAVKAGLCPHVCALSLNVPSRVRSKSAVLHSPAPFPSRT